MKVYIGVPTAEFARQAVFYDYLDMLEKPEGSITRKFHTNSAAKNRNLIIDDAFAHGCTHILFIDDDMAFPPNSLMKLLNHNLDIVSGLYFDRTYPHPPVLFNEPEAIDDYRYENGFERRYLRDGELGLIEVGACGFGFLLVKAHVFSQLNQPYVKHGQTRRDERNEDIDFCSNARLAGFKIHCDLSCIVGHMGIATYWPRYINGEWLTAIDTGTNRMVSCRQETEDVEEITTVSGAITSSSNTND